MAEDKKVSTNPKDRIGISKVPLSLIPLSAQIHTSLAHFDGSLKYGRVNWRSEIVGATIYVDAALRHILKWFDGEELDADSGVHHLGHAAACLNILMDSQHVGNMIDDRPVTSNSAETLDKFRDEVIRLLKLRGKEVPSTPPINGDKEGALADHRDSINWLYDELEEESIAEAESLPELDVDSANRALEDHRQGRSIEELEKELDERIHRVQLQVKKDSEERQKLRNKIQWTEVIHGRTVDFISTTQGFIDGEFLSGTAFIHQLCLLRNGCDNVDERVQKQERGEL